MRHAHTIATRTAAGLLLAAVALPLRAQDAAEIARRVAAAPDGTVRLSYATRGDVCGDGANIRRGPGDRGRYNGPASRDVDWDDECTPGPARLVLGVRNHQVTSLRVYVGGRWRQRDSVTDLGTVPARAAADYLLSLARTDAGRAGREAIFPATIADSAVVWPALVRMARDERLAEQTRKQSVFWLSQAAGDAITDTLGAIAAEDTTDRAVREQAVFALSQRPRDESVPALIRIARTNHDPQIRRKAIFWLGQSEDPRAIALFEELLGK